MICFPIFFLSYDTQWMMIRTRMYLQEEWEETMDAGKRTMGGGGGGGGGELTMVLIADDDGRMV